MIVPRINQLPILLFLLTSTHANANIQEFGLGTNPASDSPQDLYRREFTQEKPDQWDEYADSNITECISRCHKALQAGIDVGTNYLPLCAWTDQIYATYNEDIKNINHCQCSDRKYQAQKFECVVKKFRPAFNELCLLDDIPEKNIPKEVPFVTKLWPNYTFAKQWPEETATTWIPSASIPLREKAGTANPELTCSNFPEKDNGAVERNARKGLMELVVLLAIVMSSSGAFL